MWDRSSERRWGPRPSVGQLLPQTRALQRLTDERIPVFLGDVAERDVGDDGRNIEIIASRDMCRTWRRMTLPSEMP